MRPGAKWALQSFFYALLTVPVGVVATFFLTPFWRWIESTYGIESLGHSGPSDWCFYLIFLLVLIQGLVAIWIRAHRG